MFSSSSLPSLRNLIVCPLTSFLICTAGLFLICNIDNPSLTRRTACRGLFSKLPFPRFCPFRRKVPKSLNQKSSLPSLSVRIEDCRLFYLLITRCFVSFKRKDLFHFLGFLNGRICGHDFTHAERESKRDFQHAFAVFQHHTLAKSGMPDVIALLPLGPRLGSQPFFKRRFFFKQR